MFKPHNKLVYSIDKGSLVHCLVVTLPLLQDPQPLSSAEVSLYCGEAGEKEKESARGTMGRGKREERTVLDSGDIE